METERHFLESSGEKAEATCLGSHRDTRDLVPFTTWKTTRKISEMTITPHCKSPQTTQTREEGSAPGRSRMGKEKKEPLLDVEAVLPEGSHL